MGGGDLMLHSCSISMRLAGAKEEVYDVLSGHKYPPETIKDYLQMAEERCGAVNKLQMLGGIKIYVMCFGAMFKYRL